MQLNEFKSKRPSLFGYFFASLIGAILGGFLLLVFGPSVLFEKFQTTPAGELNKPAQVVKQVVSTPNPNLVKGNVALIADQVIPAVVFINTSGINEASTLQGKTTGGVGTGVIIDKEGYILTNNHIAGIGAQNITVTLYNGSSIKGRAVWTNQKLDLTLIKVNANNLNAAALGDSNSVAIGNSVIALGSPIGLRYQRSITTGVISSINRTIKLGEKDFMEDMLQTDASINVGNSGGPLINENGEIIGINTTKLKTSEGMGFAIPINIIKPVIASIKKNGSFANPYTGVTGLDKEVFGFLNIPAKEGIYVYDVARRSPAKEAGIEKGDLILSVNNKKVSTVIDFKIEIFKAGVNNKVKLKIKSKLGEEKLVDLTLKKEE